ncbi:MAG: sulfite reductase, partial [Anaerolineae bacterium]
FDYFYENFWTTLNKANHLRLDLAFSRDQPEKVYVQHKMYENAADLWTWLQEGAYFYVCGDAHRMAKDVEAMLLRIIQEQGGLSEEKAKAYLKSLRTQKRYLLDVY